MKVYFIRDAGTGHVKIGCSRQPEERVRALQSAHVGILTLEAVRRGGFGIEHALHRHLSGKHVRGEWFALTPEDVAEWSTKRVRGSNSQEPQSTPTIRKQIGIGLTRHDHALIARAAKKAGRPIAGWMRFVAITAAELADVAKDGKETA